MVNYRLGAIGLIEKPDLKEEPEAEGEKAPEPVAKRSVLFDGEEDYIMTPVYDRNQIMPGCTIEGPAIIEQMDSTCVIPPGWSAYTDGYRNIRARDTGGKAYEA